MNSLYFLMIFLVVPQNLIDSLVHEQSEKLKLGATGSASALEFERKGEEHWQSQ